MARPLSSTVVVFQVVAILLIAMLLYVLSHAPFVACYHEESSDLAAAKDPFGSDVGYELPCHIGIYQPVEWLMDETPLAMPLLKWGELWGVRSKLERDSFVRQLLSSGISMTWDPLNNPDCRRKQMIR